MAVADLGWLRSRLVMRGRLNSRHTRREQFSLAEVISRETQATPEGSDARLDRRRVPEESRCGDDCASRLRRRCA